jgi:hypothetical protein
MFAHQSGRAKRADGPISAQERIGHHLTTGSEEGLKGSQFVGGQVSHLGRQIHLTDRIIEALGRLPERETGKVNAPLLANHSQEGDIVLEQRNSERAHDSAVTKGDNSQYNRVDSDYQDYYTVFTPPSKHDILPLRQPNGLTGHAGRATIDGLWLRVRKALSPYIHLEMDENRQAELAGQLARRIQRWGLGGPVSVILDALEPFAFVGGQLLWILQPTLGLLVGSERIAEYALMLERPEGLKLLRAQLKES